ncbi:MAG: beta-glucosidase [Chloroflexi bacterium]|nr:beta-glucosidase [Chloroflexota bacterium]
MTTVEQHFPADFIWGTATSSYQIEGAVHEDGRGESIWDRFSHTPGKTKFGQTGDIACDHYHRYPEDLDLMRELGLASYRFSIAWPRLFPEGKGKINQAGLDFYKRIIEGLHQRHLTPMATLYHWDLPQALQDKGGWMNRDTALRFAEYAEAMYRQLGTSVPFWITHNEPWVAAFVGHFQGRHAPGIKDLPSAVKASHHLLYSHGLATQLFRESKLAGQIGITLNLTPAYPTHDTPDDHAAAWRNDGYGNRWFLDPIFRGSYPADTVEWFNQHHQIEMDYVQTGDLAVIQQPIDFLGINYYFPNRISAADESKFLALVNSSAIGETSFRGWEVVPAAFADLLKRVQRDYGNTPIYITENGSAFADLKRAADGSVNDGDRMSYLHTHLEAVADAIAAGVPVKGYYAWSMLDNYEWAEGYDERFGIIEVDFATQKRTPKRTARWYQQIVANNGLPSLPADVQALAERYRNCPIGPQD